MGSKYEVLLVTDVLNLPSSIIMWATRMYGDRVQESTTLKMLTDILEIGSKLSYETSSVDVVISFVETPGFHNWAWLLEVSRVLKTGGDFRIQEPLVSRKPTNEERKRLASTLAQDKVNLERSLLLAGYVNVEMGEPMDGIELSNEYKFITPTHISSINGPLLKPFAMKANKPTWDLGSTFAIKKKIPYSLLGKHYTNDGDKDRHTEATTQTKVKYYKDVNVSTQIIHDRNDRYLDPYHQTYEQQTEAMVQTEYNFPKDVLIGGDTPLHTSRAASRVTSLDRFHQAKECQSMPCNQIHRINEDNSQPMLCKQIFKLDLSSVFANKDSFDPLDNDEAFIDEDDNSSLYHESSTCRALKTPCRYCLSEPYEVEARQQQTNQYSPWKNGRIQNTFSCVGCAMYSKSPALVFVDKASQALHWIAKYPYKLCKVLAIKLYHWCCIKGKHLYRKLKILTSWCIRKLRELIIHVTPYSQSFIASSSSWPIVGLFLPNHISKSIHVDKATQACSRSIRRPLYLCSHKPVDTGFKF